MSDLPHLSLTQSRHGPLPGVIATTRVDPSEIVEVNLILRRRADGPTMPDPGVLGTQPPRRRQHVSRKDFETLYGAAPEDIEAVQNFARVQGLVVVRTSVVRRTVTIAGSAAQFATAFGVQLLHFTYAAGTYRSHFGPIQVPNTLSSIVTAVIGFDERPAAIPHARERSAWWDPQKINRSQIVANYAAYRHLSNRLEELNQQTASNLARDPSFRNARAHYERWAVLASRPTTGPATLTNLWHHAVIPQVKQATKVLSQETGNYLSGLNEIWNDARRLAILAALDELDIKTPPGVARLYQFPEDADGSGQCVGIIELGGGFLPQTMTEYFAFCGVTMPDISTVSVAGGANQPGINEPFDGEVCLDIQVIGGAAPGAKIVCYFAPITAAGFIEAVHTAIHDSVNSPSVLSVSWDLSEAFWLEAPMYLNFFEEVLAEAAVLGVSVCCSAGDYGSATEYLDGRAWVEYPASSPHSLACGGTTLYSRGNRILDERVWNTATTYFQATGGGVSQVFPFPSWQSTADVPKSVNPGNARGRGVPDVAANSDPNTGYLVDVNGRTTVICGTSSAAPLWAALIARINQSLGLQVGYINPFLYQNVDHTKAFRDILIVGNGVYNARQGWDACTGWGTPIGVKLRDALGQEPDATG